LGLGTQCWTRQFVTANLSFAREKPWQQLQAAVVEKILYRGYLIEKVRLNR
jgi:hypothetical protein